MQHDLAPTFRITPSLHAATCRRPLRGRATTGRALLVRIVGVAALVAASVAAIADQSTRFVSGQEIVGVHEIPAFIAGRVELTPGLSPESPAPAAASGASGFEPSAVPQHAANPGRVRTAEDAS